MAYKIIRINNNKYEETRLYRLLEEKELPIYIGSSFLIEKDEHGAFWIYVMTLKEDKIYHDKNTQSSNRTGFSGYNAAVCNVPNDLCR
ncbi:hypothetical protein [Hydrogenoanaerobacterium saccharovorans]|uniref:hypothetical protein n=1 Tax=Hydrogenoanaerobacterium saccharovorans TaxID=474960 RepID=UPI000B863508|nr:hypothetical protein [Hydrogenoanaerobacterium saccharovorans]